MSITICLYGLVTVLLFFYIHRKRSLQRNLYPSLPGPQVSWFWGNLLTISLRRTEHLQIPLLSKKYGKTWVFYEGYQPTIVSSDISFLHHIFVRQFHKFHGRKQMILQETPDSKRADMFSSEGGRWKRLRMIVNPAFSEGKLKAMFPLMLKSVNIFMDNMRQASENGEPINIGEKYKQLTLDVIGECAFGVQFESQSNESHFLLRRLKKLFEHDFAKLSFSKFMILARATPELHFFYRFVLKLARDLFPSQDAEPYVRERMTDVIAARKQTGDNNYVDLLQLMLNANETGITLDENNNEVFNRREHTTDVSNSTKFLTEGEIKSSAYLFLLAGYETSSTALSYITYCLANNMEVQKRLQMEINNVFGDYNETTCRSGVYEDYSKLCQLKFMDNVINESLRLFPVVTLLPNRRCIEATEINGYNIKEGTNILPDIMTLHYDEQLWGPTDPKQFNPDRFNSPRHPVATMAFGAGPRRCIGQRFAMMEMKSTLVQILHQYTISTCSETKIPMELRYGVTTHPKDMVVLLNSRYPELCK